MNLSVRNREIERVGTLLLWAVVACLSAYALLGPFVGRGPYETTATVALVGILLVAYYAGITTRPESVSTPTLFALLFFGVVLSVFSLISLRYPSHRGAAIYLLAYLALAHILGFWIGQSVFLTDDTPPLLATYVFGPLTKRLPERLRPSRSVGGTAHEGYDSEDDSDSGGGLGYDSYSETTGRRRGL